MGKLPTLPMALAPTRAALLSSTTSSSTSSSASRFVGCQLRHATFIHRPRRPYHFTQLVQLSDGSTYVARTTSPQPLYKASKDTRNTLTWQPSEKSLKNIELDEAGKLAAFRERFGRGFDASAVSEETGDAPAPAADEGFGDLADLITGYATQDTKAMRDSGPKKAPTRRK